MSARKTVVVSLTFSIEEPTDATIEKLKDSVEDVVLDAQYDGNLAFDGSIVSCLEASVTGEYDSSGQ